MTDTFACSSYLNQLIQQLKILHWIKIQTENHELGHKNMLPPRMSRS